MKRAVVIGINYWGTKSQLCGCNKDTSDMREYLESIGYTVRVMNDAEDDPEHTREDSPTRARILGAFKTAVSATGPGDYLYIHYSGHGSRVTDTNGDELDGKDETICPVDYSTAGDITDDELRAIVDKLHPRAHTRIVFDCCHSGTGIDLPYKWVLGGVFSTESTAPVHSDVIFISGCRDSQTSADASFAGRPNGALTWALLKALREIRGAKLRTHTWRDLMEMIRFKLLKCGFDQVPQLCTGDMKSVKLPVDLC